MDTAPAASGGRLTGLRSIVQRLGWGVADQAVSSLSNFAMGLYVAAAFSGKGGEDFGAFSLAYVTYSVVLNASRGLSTDPLLVRYSGADRLRWRNGSARSSGMALIVGVVFGLICVGAGLLMPQPLGGAFVGLGVFLPGLLLQDSWRFAFFADGRGRDALINDVVWSVLLVGAVFSLHGRQVPVGWYLAAFGGTATVAGLFGIAQARLMPRPVAAGSWLAENRDLSWRYLTENVSISGASQLRAFALGAVAGLTPVGWVRAADMLMGPFLVILMGIAQVAVPEASRALRRSTSTLFRFCLMLAGLQAVAASAWALAVYVIFPMGLGQRLLHDLWAPSFALLLPTALTYVVMSFSTAAAAGIRAMGMARFSLRAQLFNAAAFLIGGVLGALIDGAPGTVWGGLIATVIGAAYWWQNLRQAAVAWQLEDGAASMVQNSEGISPEMSTIPSEMPPETLTQPAGKDRLDHAN